MRTLTTINATLATLTTLGLPLTADTLRFNNADSFTGHIQKFTSDTLFLQTPNTTEPLQIHTNQISSILFDPSENTPKNTPSKHLLKLSNGDTIEGNFQSLDENNLTFQTPYGDALAIERDKIQTLYFNVKSTDIIYSGPRGLGGWTSDNGWDYENGDLFSTGQGNIARELKLPDQFSITTTFAWLEKPNMRIYICASDPDPYNSEHKSACYYLTLNAGGLALHRYEPKSSKQYINLAQLDSIKARINSRKGTLELRINRKNAKVALYYNGQNLGTFRDPSGVSPTGSHIIFSSNSANHKANIIKQIEVRDWNASSELYHAEEPSEDDIDTLTTTEGQRFSGQILKYDPLTSSFSLNHPHTDNPVDISIADCSVIHFKKSAQETPPAAFLLTLISGNTLNLTSATLEQNGTLTATHPLLGDIDLKREALNKISRITPPKK